MLNLSRYFIRKNEKVFWIVIILVIANLPYVINIQQDLLTEPIAHPIVCHDEAAFGMNAKDILLFGWQSLKHDRLYIVWPLNVLIALISFSFLGVSLASLRLPYIAFNILGNILFFDFLRRAAGKKIALTVTCLFAFFVPRIIIGKSAMAESLVLPMLLIISWITVFTFKHPKIYFLSGLFVALAGIAKIDNIVVFLPLLTFAFIDDIAIGMAPQRRYYLFRTRWFLTGVSAVVLIWIIFLGLIGFDKAIYYYKFELGSNDILASWFGFYGNPGTLELIKNNMAKLWERDHLFALLICIFVPVAVMSAFNDYNSWRNPILRGGIVFLALFVFKIAFSSYLVGQWRFAPCYPLPFLMSAYIYITFRERIGILVDTCFSLKYYRLLALFIVICVLFLVGPFINKSLQSGTQILFHPTYKILKTAERVRKVIDPRFRVIFAEGHFTYCTLFLPVKCYDVVPNIEAEDFFTLESDSKKMLATIEMDKQIAYLMVRDVNKVVLDFVKSIPGAQLIMTDALPFNVGYIYQIRWLQDNK